MNLARQPIPFFGRRWPAMILALALLLSQGCNLPAGPRPRPTLPPVAGSPTASERPAGGLPTAGPPATATPPETAAPPTAWAEPEAQPLPGLPVPTVAPLPGNTPQSPVGAGPAEGWPMAGADPARSSRTGEEVKGALRPEWFVPFEAYLPQRAQIIASNNTLFVSTAAGLYALDAANGAQRWFYPTALPLGHSPTIHAGVAYVGGFDHKLHAIDIATGQPRWTFSARKGFQTNPVVAEGLVLAGSRDGAFYAVRVADGALAWKFETGGPILYSAAYAAGVVYFAANDNFAYALRVADGARLWQSQKLPGHGFHSWWPVIYGDYVVFSGTYNYRYVKPFPAPHTALEQEAYPPGASKGDTIGPPGKEPGDWLPGTTTIHNTGAAQYLEANPHRRTYFVLERASGREFTYDADGDGQPEYAPILWQGTHSGTRYPPAVGPDGVLYQGNNLFYDPYIPRGTISGWKFGTPYVTQAVGSGTAVDEPLAYAIGGNTVYWKRCCDRKAGAFEIASATGSAADLKSWIYYDEGGLILRKYAPELFARGWDFAYWKHGDQSPPIPYQGRVYAIVNNAVVAFSPNGHGVVLKDLGKNGFTGEKAEDVLRAESFTGLNTRLTLDENTWPLLVQQETYYATNNSVNAAARWFRLFEVRAGQAAPTGFTPEDLGITTNVSAAFPGGSLETWVSRRSPTTLFRTGHDRVTLAGSLAGLAAPVGGQAQVFSPGQTLDGAALEAGWLLAWDRTGGDEGGGAHRWAPLVISLEHRPQRVEFSAAGLELVFSGPAGFLAVTPLNGMSAPRSAEEQAWADGIPPATLERVRLLDRTGRAFPLTAAESWAVDEASGDVELSWEYEYLEFGGDLDARPLRVAYLPPPLALAAWNGAEGGAEGGAETGAQSAGPAAAAPITVEGRPLAAHLDLQWVTPLGRVAGVAEAARVTVRLPGLSAVWRQRPAPPAPPNEDDPLYLQLVAEIRAMLAAGHLLPGYGLIGIWETRGDHRVGDWLADYYHNPADTVYTLLLALPLLPADLQVEVRAYLQAEMARYPLHKTAHTGWQAGANRHAFDLPPEVLAAAQEFGPQPRTSFSGWGLPPHNLYALALAVETFAGVDQTLGAEQAFARAGSQLDRRPKFQTSLPYALNSTIAGYIGYLRLAALAAAGPQAEAERTLIDLLILRAALSRYPDALAAAGFEYGGYAWSLRRFAPNQPDTLFSAAVAGSLWSQMPLYGLPTDGIYGLAGASTGGDYAFGIDFVNLTPELAGFLRRYAPAETAQAVAAYLRRAPYWFVAEAAETGGEGVLQPLYDRAAYFQALALVLGQDRAALEPYLDVPAMAVGDLFYLQNLAILLGAGRP